MPSVHIPLRFAPEQLTQSINPGWNVSLYSVNLGTSGNAALEPEVLAKVGSYGRQIGHLAEALEVVIRQLSLLDRATLSTAERDVLQVFLGDVAAVRRLKPSPAPAPAPDAPSAVSQATSAPDAITRRSKALSRQTAA